MDLVDNRSTKFAVALLAKVQKVVHVQSADLAINRVDQIARERLAHKGEHRIALGHQTLSHLLVDVHVGSWQPVTDGRDHGFDALGDLILGLGVDVVRADADDHDVRAEVQLAVLDAPQDVLGPVASDAEVEHSH